LLIEKEIIAKFLLPKWIAAIGAWVAQSV